MKKKSVFTVNGLKADIPNAPARYSLKELTSPFTLGIQFYLYQYMDTVIWKLDDQFTVSIINKELEVRYQGTSLFADSIVPQNLSYRGVNTMDIRYDGQEISLYINQIRIGGRKESGIGLVENAGREMEIGGGKCCIVRFVRIYGECLNEEEIRERALGNERGDRKRFIKQPIHFWDFTKPVGNEEISLVGNSNIVALTESLRFGPEGEAILLADAPLLDEGDGALYMTVYLTGTEDKTECLFSSGSGTDEFAWLIRYENKKAFLDLKTGEKILKGTTVLPQEEWLDLAITRKGDRLSSYINAEKDIDAEAQLPGGACQRQSYWAFGSGGDKEVRHFSGRLKTFAALDIALDSSRLELLLEKALNIYSGGVRYICEFAYLDILGQRKQKMFMNQYAGLDVMFTKLHKEDNAEYETAFLVQQADTLSQEDRKQAIIAFEYSVAVLDGLYGVKTKTDVKDLTDHQLSQILPYANDIVGVYLQNRAGVNRAQGEPQEIVSEYQMSEVCKGIVIACCICGAVALGTSIYFAITGHIIILSIAAFGIITGVLISTAMAAAIAITGIAAILLIAALIIDRLLGGDSESESESGGESEGESEEGNTPKYPDLFKLNVSLLTMEFTDSIYIRRAFGSRAENRGWSSTGNSKDKPGITGFIKEKLGDTVRLQTVLENKEQKDVNVWITGEAVYDTDKKITVDPISIKLSRGNNQVVFSMPLKQALAGVGKKRLTFDWKIKRTDGIEMTQEKDLCLDTYTLERMPGQPWDMDSADEAPTERELEIYTDCYHEKSEDYLKSIIRLFHGSSYNFTRVEKTDGASVSDDGKTVEYVPLNLDDNSQTVTPLVCAALLQRMAALAGFAGAIVKVESAAAALLIEEEQGSVCRRFPLMLKEDYGSTAISHPLEYYLFGVKCADDWRLYDLFSKDEERNGKVFSLHYISSFCGEGDKSKTTMQYNLVKHGSSAAITGRYSQIRWVKEISGGKTESGRRDVGFCPIAYSSKNRKYFMSDSILELDSLVLTNALLGMVPFCHCIGQRNLAGYLTDILNRSSDEKDAKMEENEMNKLLDCIRPLDIYSDELLDRFYTGAKEQIKVMAGLLDNGQSDPMEILQSVNLLLMNLINVKDNMVIPKYGRNMRIQGIYPREWFYYADNKVWACGDSVFSQGQDYHEFISWKFGTIDYPDPEQDGVYLPDIQDSLAIENVSKLTIESKYIPKLQLRRKSTDNSNIYFIESYGNTLKLDYGKQNAVGEDIPIFRIEELPRAWKQIQSCLG